MLFFVGCALIILIAIYVAFLYRLPLSRAYVLLLVMRHVAPQIWQQLKDVEREYDERQHAA